METRYFVPEICLDCRRNRFIKVDGKTLRACTYMDTIKELEQNRVGDLKIRCGFKVEGERSYDYD